MGSYKINLKDHTATSINGITFKLTETKSSNQTEDVIYKA